MMDTAANVNEPNTACRKTGIGGRLLFDAG